MALGSRRCSTGHVHRESTPHAFAELPFIIPHAPPPQSAKPPHGLGVCLWMPLVTGTGNSPVSGTADPRSSQTGQVIRGLR